MEGLNSDLNLNGPVSPRVVPGLGEWGPANVPSTRAKKRQRWLVIGLTVLAVGLVVALEALLWGPLS